VKHRLSRDRTPNVRPLLRQPDIDRLSLCRASLVCESSNLQIAPFEIVNWKTRRYIFRRNRGR
jgi:hypothetical protein